MSRLTCSSFSCFFMCHRSTVRLTSSMAECWQSTWQGDQVGALSYLWAASWQNQQNDVHPAKTQISLGICPVWSESSLSAWRKLRSLATHWAHSEDADAQADLSLRWAHSHFVGFVMRWLICWPRQHTHKRNTSSSPAVLLDRFTDKSYFVRGKFSHAYCLAWKVNWQSAHTVYERSRVWVALRHSSTQFFCGIVYSIFLDISY